jgi:hypothetical protein
MTTESESNLDSLGFEWDSLGTMENVDEADYQRKIRALQQF